MRMLGIALCLGLLALGVASAQIISPVEFSMDTSFTVANTTLPAGKYEIAPTADEGILEVRGAKGVPSVFFEVESLESLAPFKRTEITFNQYGGKLVLKSIMVEGETIGATSVPQHLERQHKKTSGKPVKVTRPATKKKK